MAYITKLQTINRAANSESTVITECWHGYYKHHSKGWQHLTVKYQYNFIGAWLLDFCYIIYSCHTMWAL